MTKPSLSFLLASLLAFAAHAQVAEPVIQRDAKGLVTITCATPGAVICYSVDGSDPEMKGVPAIYLGPFLFPYKGVIKAKAYERSELAADTLDAIGGVKTPPHTVIPVTQDRNWASYDWAKRHETVCALVAAKKPALIFIGDSITHFMGGEGTGRTGAAWDKYYAPRNAVNLGFGWDRTENVLWRLQHGELDGYQPKAAVVLIGTNNISAGSSPADIATGVRAICSEIHQRSPGTKILLLGIFPRGAAPGPGRETIKGINTLLAAFDGQDGITYLDIGAKFLSPDGTISKDVMADALHPTPKGYDIWAQAMLPTLQKLLGEPAASTTGS